MGLDITHVESSDNHNVYRVRFFDDLIETTVTHVASVVSEWIAKIERIHHYRLHKLVVGLDLEWRPNFNKYQPENPVAIIQLCVGHMCLIFQLLYAQHIPRSLSDFLSDQDYTFVGVGIEADAAKLENDYNLSVASYVDLRDLAADRWGRDDVKQMGLARLASEAIQVNFYQGKPKRITTSNWDVDWLTHKQIMYACIDAFMSFETGRILGAHHGV